MTKYVTNSSKETQKLGKLLAKGIKNRSTICLSGDLGSGKTTFTQGLLKGLKAKGPFTSPTFVILKHYKSEFKVQSSKFKVFNIYHIDCYRVDVKDILELGWEEIIGNKKNIVIIEWAEKIRAIIPKGSLWIKFEFINENNRKIIFK